MSLLASRAAPALISEPPFVVIAPGEPQLALNISAHARVHAPLPLEADGNLRAVRRVKLGVEHVLIFCGFT